VCQAAEQKLRSAVDEKNRLASELRLTRQELLECQTVSVSLEYWFQFVCFGADKNYFVTGFSQFIRHLYN